jgi:hypothetical protein
MNHFQITDQHKTEGNNQYDQFTQKLSWKFNDFPSHVKEDIRNYFISDVALKDYFGENGFQIESIPSPNRKLKYFSRLMDISENKTRIILNTCPTFKDHYNAKLNKNMYEEDLKNGVSMLIFGWWEQINDLMFIGCVDMKDIPLLAVLKHQGESVSKKKPDTLFKSDTYLISGSVMNNILT